MLRKLALFSSFALALTAIPATVHAQSAVSCTSGFSNVQWTNIGDATGDGLLVNGSGTISPEYSTGQPVGVFSMGSTAGGGGTRKPVHVSVTNGVLQSKQGGTTYTGVCLADSLLTTPAVGYQFTIQDSNASSSQAVAVNTGVTIITGATVNLNKFPWPGPAAPSPNLYPTAAISRLPCDTPPTVSLAGTANQPAFTFGVADGCDGALTSANLATKQPVANITHPDFGAIAGTLGADVGIGNALAFACGFASSTGGAVPVYTPPGGVFKLSAAPAIPASCNGLTLLGEPGNSFWEQDFNAVNLTPLATVSIPTVTTVINADGSHSSTYSFSVPSGSSLPSGTTLFFNISGANTAALNVARSVTSSGITSNANASAMSYIVGANATGTSAAPADSSAVETNTGTAPTTDQTAYAQANISQTTANMTSAATGTFTLTTNAPAGTESETSATATVQNLAVAPLFVDSANATRIQGLQVRPGGSTGLAPGILSQLAFSTGQQDANGSFLTLAYTTSGGVTPTAGMTVSISGAPTGFNVQSVIVSVGAGTLTIPYASSSPACVTACSFAGAVADVRYTSVAPYFSGNADVRIADSDFSGFSNAAVQLNSVSDAHIENSTFLNNNGPSISFSGSLSRAWILNNHLERTQASAPGSGDPISIKPTIGSPAEVFVIGNDCKIGHGPFCEETQGLIRKEVVIGNKCTTVSSPILSTSTGNALHGCFSRQGIPVASFGEQAKDASGQPSGYPHFEVFGSGQSYEGWSSVGNGVAAYTSESKFTSGTLLGGSFVLTLGNTMGQGSLVNNIIALNTLSSAGVGPYDVWQANWRVISGNQRIEVCYDIATSAWVQTCDQTKVNSGTQLAAVFLATHNPDNADNYTGATFPTLWCSPNGVFDHTYFDGGVWGQESPCTVQDNNVTWTLYLIPPVGAYNQVQVSCAGNAGVKCYGNKVVGNIITDINGGSGSKRFFHITSGIAPIHAFPSSTAAASGVLTFTVPYKFGSPSSNGVQGGTPAAGMTATFASCTSSSLNAATATVTAYTAPTASANGTITFSSSVANFSATETVGTCQATLNSSSWVANTSLGNEFKGNTLLGCSTGIIQVSATDGPSTKVEDNTETDPMTGTACPLGTSSTVQHCSAESMLAGTCGSGSGGGSGSGAGTITGVTAGTGLTGGGSSGTVTLGVDTTYLGANYAPASGSSSYAPASGSSSYAPASGSANYQATLSGSNLVPIAAMPALTGDVTTTAGAVATSVGKIGGAALSSLSSCTAITFNSSGIPICATLGTAATQSSSAFAPATGSTAYDAINAASAVKSYFTSIGGVLKSNGTSTTYAQGGSDIQIPATGKVYGTYCFGDSTYYGLYTANATGIFCNALAQDVPGPSYDYGMSGYYAEQIASFAWQIWNRTVDLNQVPYIAYEGGINNANQTSGIGGGNSTGALQNAVWATESGVVHLYIPLASQQMSSTAGASTGTWAAFSNATYLPLNAAITGTMMSSATSGSTRTYTLPAGASVAYSWVGLDSNAGTFTVTLNGTLQTNNCTGTTTFTASGCSSATIGVNGGYSFFTQVFSGGNTGSSNSLVVTVTSSSGSVYDVAAATVPSSPVNSPVIGIQGVLKQYTDILSSTTAAYDTAIKSVYTDLLSKGFTNVFFVDVRNGVAASVSTQAVAAENTTTDFVLSGCAGGNINLHPNECFNQRLAKMHEAAAVTAGLPIATPNAGQPLQYQRYFVGSNLTADFTNDIYINSPGQGSSTLRSPGLCLFGLKPNCNGRISVEYAATLSNYAEKIASTYTTAICGLYSGGGAPTNDSCQIFFSAYSRTGMEAVEPIRVGIGGGFDSNAMTSNNNLAMTWESQQRVNTATSACTALICYVGGSVTTLTLPACGTYSSNYNGDYWQDYINDSGSTISSLTLSASTSNPTDLINGAATKVYSSVVPYQRLHVQCSRATATASDISVTSMVP